MVWRYYHTYLVNIYHEVIPKTYIILILPLLIAILLNQFSDQIKGFLLSDKEVTVDIPIKSTE